MSLNAILVEAGSLMDDHVRGFQAADSDILVAPVHGKSGKISAVSGGLRPFRFPHDCSARTAQFSFLPAADLAFVGPVDGFVHQGRQAERKVSPVHGIPAGKERNSNFIFIKPWGVLHG